MHDKIDIISILNAVDEINSKTKKKKIDIIPTQSSLGKLNPNLIVPPDVDKLIREAEDYKKLSIIAPKTIPVQNKRSKSRNEKVLILTDEVAANTLIENVKIIELNNKIKNLVEADKKLRLQIGDLKKSNVLLSKGKLNTLEIENSENDKNHTKKTLKSIYRQVEEQKKIFLNLKNHTLKIERDSNVFKENYERLIIENNELKTRLKIAKEQIVNYEANKIDLVSALDQLNKILSKSNVIGKISPDKITSDKASAQKETKIKSVD